ncbi:MAG: hypothetical protein KGL98_01840 [Gammaproteobacteria bacterium]|nr:hypothetical protein [Gammaproteobacteria bacterium]
MDGFYSYCAAAKADAKTQPDFTACDHDVAADEEPDAVEARIICRHRAPELVRACT